jgi:hypothetical protein
MRLALYKQLLKPILFSIDAETVHHFAIDTLSWISRFPWLLDLAPRLQDPKLAREVFGLKFPNPVGLAAGFDKNAVALPAWAALGFGFTEVGTITAQGQPGNPRPRIFRLPEMEGLINRLGFNNDGADAIASCLEQLRATNRWPSHPVGINIGKTKIIPIESATEDYVSSFRRLKDLGDYFVLNVSSPNTPRLRQLQERGAIAELFRAIQLENSEKPLLVKIAPDLTWPQIDDDRPILSAGIQAGTRWFERSAVASAGARNFAAYPQTELPTCNFSRRHPFSGRCLRASRRGRSADSDLHWVHLPRTGSDPRDAGETARKEPGARSQELGGSPLVSSYSHNVETHNSQLTTHNSQLYYFPMQNSLKIFPRRSSLSVLPTTSPTASRASRSSIEMNSGD